jgi:hypothetical protein
VADIGCSNAPMAARATVIEHRPRLSKKQLQRLSAKSGIGNMPRIGDALILSTSSESERGTSYMGANIGSSTSSISLRLHGMIYSSRKTDVAISAQTLSSPKTSTLTTTMHAVQGNAPVAHALGDSRAVGAIRALGSFATIPIVCAVQPMRLKQLRHARRRNPLIGAPPGAPQIRPCLSGRRVPSTTRKSGSHAPLALTREP